MAVVKVRSWVMHYVCQSPHEDRSITVCAVFFSSSAMASSSCRTRAPSDHLHVKQPNFARMKLTWQINWLMLCIIHACSTNVPDPLLPLRVSVKFPPYTHLPSRWHWTFVRVDSLRHFSWPVSRREMQTRSQSSTFVILSISDTLINSFECKQVSSVTRCIRPLMLAQEQDGLFTDLLINHCTNWLKSAAGMLLLGHTAFMHNHVNKPSQQTHKETHSSSNPPITLPHISSAP